MRVLVRGEGVVAQKIKSKLSKCGITLISGSEYDYIPDIIVNACSAEAGELAEDGEAKQLKAGFVIGIGSGYCVGQNCHCFIVSEEGPELGRIIYDPDRMSVPSCAKLIIGEEPFLRTVAGGVLEAVFRYVARAQSLGIVMLAAGEGKRFGRNKLLTKIDGQLLFTHSVDAVSEMKISEHEGIEPEKIIVTGYPEIAQYVFGKKVGVVYNTKPEEGISRSIRMGLEELLNKDAVLFTVCDQPGVTLDTYKRLIDAYISSDKELACLGRGKDILGNPCIFSKKYYSELMKLTGDVGGKGIIKKHKDELIIVKASIDELRDIDMAEDIPDGSTY